MNRKIKQNLILKEKTLIDYFIYPISLILEPLLHDSGFIGSLWRLSNSGRITILTLVLGGFIIVSFYKSILLSHLTAVTYEKTIETIDGN